MSIQAAALGDRVRTLRTAKGWTQEQLAREMDSTLGTVQRIESGRSPHLDTLRKVAEALGVPLAELLEAVA